MRETVSVLLRAGGINALLRLGKKGQITALCFHRVTNETNFVWPPLKVDVFKKVIEYCSKWYSIITPQQWIEQTPKPKMIITFDDGFYDFMECALPILTENKVPAVHHVVISSVLTGNVNWTYRLNAVLEDYLKSCRKLKIDRKEFFFNSKITRDNVFKTGFEIFQKMKYLPQIMIDSILEELSKTCVGDLYFPRMMNSDDLIECEKNGVQIECHGFYHTILRGDLEESVLNTELNESKKTLEGILSHPVSSFAFPAGSYDPKLIELTGAAGYNFAFTTEEALSNDPVLISNTEPVLFHRIIVPSSKANEAILKIENFHSKLKKFRKH